MAGKKPVKANVKQDDSTNFPGLQQQQQQPGSVKTAYEERQEEELTALEAIYGDDFVQHKAAHSAWKKSEPSFDIRIRAPSDEDVALTLGVVLTATYPKSVPLLTLKDRDGLRDSTVFKAQKYLEKNAKEHAAEDTVMIYLLVEGIREILEDAAIAKAQGLELPSLEEERAAHEAKIAQAALDEKQQEDRKRQEEALEEERALGALVEQERERQRTKAKELRKKNRSHIGSTKSPERAFGSEAPDEAMVFDEPCEMVDTTGNTVQFKAVTGRFLMHTGPISKIYLVKPILPGDQDECSLALKQTELQTSANDSVAVLKQMQSLETQLIALKRLRRQKVHRNIVDVIDFRIDRASGMQSVQSDESPGQPQPPPTSPTRTKRPKSPRLSQSQGSLTQPLQPQEQTTWTVSILSLMSDKGSLEDILELAGHLEVTKVRAWTRDLLDALDFLHGHGLLHEDLHPSNVLLCRDATSDIIPKLADASYQQLMHSIYSRSGPTIASTRTARSAYWLPPEIAGASRPTYTQKTDVWDFGLIFLQMVFGLDVPQKYHSPKDIMDSLNLSDPLAELVSKLFMPDPKKRPRAFDLGSSEFLATDAPILSEDTFAVDDAMISIPQSLPTRFRRDSTTRVPKASRYREDFIEEGRLGKGGFGEVVKARKKLDGQIYAIKKITITQSSGDSLTVTDILKEVRLLSQLSHPAVVRYYNAWLEEIHDFSGSEGETATEGYSSREREDLEGFNIEFTKSGGLDFLSSGPYPNIVFGSDSDEEGGNFNATDEDSSEEEEEDEVGSSDDDASNTTETNDGNNRMPARGWSRTRRGSQRPSRTIMYISMEYCEKRSLRDLIARNLSKDTQEVWRLFRQLLEGLTHIHGLGIVHRDLKPDNIFIGSGADGVNNAKIGDFGLATTGQLTAADKALTSGTMDATDETRSIGTSVYVAPEVRSGGSGSYTTKVDMYSLGVIFFEMCYPPMIGMQRADVLTKLRGSPPVLPADFKPKEKSQVDIIQSLLTHNPKERPSGAELLKSGKLPVQMESETIRHALAELSDPTSPYYQKMLSMLFARPVEQAKDYAWDMSSMQTAPSSQDLMRQYTVKEMLVSVFRRHGAVETTRSSLYPMSSLYGGANVVQLLDRNGNLLQLPFDLTMGNARALARCITGGDVVAKSYTFGSIFRERAGGGQPSMFGEVDFDLVTTHTLDLALREAEVIKVIDEITVAFPTLRNSPLCFQLGHSDLLKLIFDFCGVDKKARRAVADVLSRLNIHGMTWAKLRVELRSPLVGASTTSIDELQKFDFRDTPSKAFSKLKTLFVGTDSYERASSTLAHMREVHEYCKRLGVTNKMYVCPLNTWNEAFFSGGIMFSCLLDKKVKDVFAAGGRYDGLIKEYRPRFGSNIPDERHAVGFSLNWEKLAQAPPRSSGKAFLKRAAEEEANGAFSAKRCDVLVASFDPTILRSVGVELVRTLWAHGISAELAGDARSTEELVSKNRDEGHAWIAIVKQDGVVKIRTMPASATGGGGLGSGSGSAAAHRNNAPDVEMALSQVMAWLRAEMRERESTRTGTITKASAAAAAASSSLEGSSVGGSHGFGHHAANEHDGYDGQDVRVLVGHNKSKKFNRQAVVEQAQVNAARLVRSFLAGPIAAVETTDQVLTMIQATSLSDPDSWRRLEQNVNTVEKKYVREVQGMLVDWRTAYEVGTGSRHAFVYNFRTGTCIYYDLGA
ncbi:protein kinase [Grosmannia clavigera kw1407]|uniref:non-specific serine/threonine protein kinase n=1 Tax=Grosmannia clavigera (strain kw1407 / UAMH 11150) TaxID=655863 RepID=F0XG95_GROCL|nr:protein kinase [Grosmannia clavigera kw1407]EFX02753.1 protein kinase [Grosmannia clavigera kw1407]